MQVFIVKIWKESPEGKNWRGQIQNASTGLRVTVANMDELVGLIHRCFHSETKPHPDYKKGLR